MKVAFVMQRDERAETREVKYIDPRHVWMEKRGVYLLLIWFKKEAQLWFELQDRNRAVILKTITNLKLKC